MQTATVVNSVEGNHHDAEYHAYLARVKERFVRNVRSGEEPIFTTDATDLWGAYLGTFSDPAERQYHNCHTCRQFVERFGSLVTVDEKGFTSSAVWDEEDTPAIYKPAVVAMSRLVRKAKVTGVFMSSEREWGTGVTGIWQHWSITPPNSMIFRSAVLTAGQAMAEKREDFKTVMYALNEFTQPMLEQALTLLRTDSLYRSEKVLGQAEWLYNLHVARTAAHGTNKANVVWRHIATAPAGFCHPRSSMIGTLLEDIAVGMDFNLVSRRFAEKMHPLQYQRPQAAPTAGAIAAAEKIVQQLGAAGALARRFARVDEVQAIWKPKDKPADVHGAGVFGHLKAKDEGHPTNMKIPAQVMTWEKFARTVLPNAEQIEFYARPGSDSYTSLVTAVNPDAPPILQWDNEAKRNPVSWYFWHGGSTPASFSLAAGVFHPVVAIAFKPNMWNGDNSHHGEGAMLVIKGAKDTCTPGACLFPEILKSEFHAVRSVIEAYSREATMQGADEGSAAGLMMQKGGTLNVLLRVHSGGSALEYRIDRWD
ncbi:MAG: hypothetical protein C0422_09745 [Alcaligenaceae bacterium]|nr:hypothetical protein [Alcaligenaceae bacterium]